jgi:hypothetical protein
LELEINTGVFQAAFKVCKKSEKSFDNSASPDCTLTLEKSQEELDQSPMAPEIDKRAYAKLDDKGSFPEFAQRKQRNFLQRYIFTTINTIILALLLATSALALIWTRSNFRNGRWHPQTMVPRSTQCPPVNFQNISNEVHSICRPKDVPLDGYVHGLYRKE